MYPLITIVTRSYRYIPIQSIESINDIQNLLILMNSTR